MSVAEFVERERKVEQMLVVELWKVRESLCMEEMTVVEFLERGLKVEHGRGNVGCRIVKSMRNVVYRGGNTSCQIVKSRR